MPVAALHDLSESYLRFASKIGVITDADFDRELPGLRGKEPTQIGQALVEKGVLHPNNFKLLESMFARQLARMTHAVHAAAEPPKPKPVEPKPTIDSQEPPKALGLDSGLDVAKADTTKLKGSAQATTRYKIVRPLCTSRLSELFIAEDVELHREVVLKRLQAKHQRSPGFRIRFNRTAEVTSGLEHPCIPPIYNHGLDADGRPYYTTRYLTGETLADAVARLHGGDPADPPRSLDTKSSPEGLRRLLQRLLRVCDALSYAHHRGVVHCSLTPQRLLLGKYNETLVVGWGRSELIYGKRPRPSSAGAKAKPLPAAKDISTGGRPPREASQSRLETANYYTSPEQLAGDPAAAGILSDVYSLGAILFFVATGRPPFEAPAEELPARIEAGLKPTDFADLEELSPPLARTCAKAMAVDPMKRYASVREFAAEVEAWLDLNPGRAAVAAIAATTPEPAPSRAPVAVNTFPRWWLALGVTGACLLAGGAGVWLGRSSRPPRSEIAAALEAKPAGEVPSWIPLGVAAVEALPDAVEATVSAAKRFPIPLRAEGPKAATLLVAAADAARARKDHTEAAKRLQEAQPLLFSTSESNDMTAIRQRWSANVAALGEQPSGRKTAAELLSRALSDVAARRTLDETTWATPLAEHLGKLDAQAGRFADAVKTMEPLANTSLESPNNAAAASLVLLRAECLGLVGRRAEATVLFHRLADAFANSDAASGKLPWSPFQRLRSLIGLAEQQLAQDNSADATLGEAVKTAEALKESSNDGTKVLFARLDAARGARLLKAGKTKDAEPFLKKATEAWAKLAAPPDADARLLCWGASAWDALHQTYSSLQKLQEALEAADRAAALLNRVSTKGSVAERLDALDNDRGVLLVQLGKLNEAEAAFARVIDRGGTSVVNARYLRSACRLEQKNLAGARADAEELANAKDGASRYLAARVFARLAGSETVSAADEDGGRAVSLLRELVTSQFFKGDRASLPATDAELDALHQRQDFKDLFAAKPAAKATASPSPAGP